MARHVWQSEEGTRRIALEGDWSYYQTRIPQGLFAILGEVKSLQEELGEIGRVHQETVEAVKAFPLERLDEIRENAKFNMRLSAGVMLFRIIEHQVHHRAQIGTYLRMLTGRRARQSLSEDRFLLATLTLPSANFLVEPKPACHYDVSLTCKRRSCCMRQLILGSLC